MAPVFINSYSKKLAHRVNYIPFSESNEQLSNRMRSFPVSWDDWLYSIYLVRACINGDFFATDKALPFLRSAYQFALKSSSCYIGAFTKDISGLMENTLTSTCRALGRFKMKEELDEASRITSYLIDRIFDGTSQGLLNVCRNEYPTEKGLNREFGIKLILNHPEKAKNAYRLGKIDEKCFQEVMGKFNLRALSEEEIISKINDFLSENEIVNRLSDAHYEIQVANPKIVAPPNFFQERFDHLEDDQKWEYLKTWERGGSGRLVLKYYYIRTQEILLGLIQNYKSINLEQLEKEIQFFSNNFGERFKRYLIISEILEYLKSLNESERCEKLQLLRSIDDPEQRSFNLVIMISLNDTAQGNYKKRITVDQDYIEFMKMDNKAIQLYRDTGAYNNVYNLAWNKDLESLKSFDESEVGKRRMKVWLKMNNPSPEEVITSSKPYIEGLLDLGRRFHPKNTGELQIGYEINRITTAYAKIKDWKAVIYWSELFFNLPINYKDRSPEEEQNKIRKRLDRAKALCENYA